MDPYQQQYPATNPGGQYDFIMSPQQPSRRFIIGGSFGRLIGLLVGGGILLLIVVALLLNALSPKGPEKQALLSLAQTQAEIIRVAKLGPSGLTQQSAKNMAATAEIAVMTQQQGVRQLLAKMGAKVKEKDLALKKNAETDAQLTSARTTSTFDETFTAIMRRLLDDYAAKLKERALAAPGDTERVLMADYYRQTQLVISQIPAS